MKKVKKGAALAIALNAGFGLAACGEKEITVSFVQDGQETIVKTVKNGETLYDIPTPVQAEGYTVTWDRTDFSALEESVTVNAVATPNVYVINYEVEAEASGCDGWQMVNYGEDFTLDVPSLDGRVFVGWKLNGTETFVENGTYSWTDNITLTAVWDVDNDNEYTYWY